MIDNIKIFLIGICIVVNLFLILAIGYSLFNLISQYPLHTLCFVSVAYILGYIYRRIEKELI